MPLIARGGVELVTKRLHAFDAGAVDGLLERIPRQQGIAREVSTHLNLGRTLDDCGKSSGRNGVE